MKIKDIFCAPENPNAFFNRNLCRINWKNLHNWGHFLLSLVLCFVASVEFSFVFMYTWEFFDGLKKHYSLAPEGNSIKNIIIRNLLYSDKFSLEDAIVFNPIGFIAFFVWSIL